MKKIYLKIFFYLYNFFLKKGRARRLYGEQSTSEKGSNRRNGGKHA